MSFEASSPLASKLRPRVLDDLVGQQHLLSEGSVLRAVATPQTESITSNLSSIVLWGPPGTGKTTIALAVAKSSGRHFIQLNAVSAGVKDIRDTFAAAINERNTYGRETIVFVDEIHRFNRSQQDALLSEVENGTILLIAATTENPSISVNGPLLSRCVLLELKPLTESNLVDLLARAAESPDGLNGEFSIPDEVSALIARLASGDARRALVLLEVVSNSAKSNSVTTLTEEAVLQVADKAGLHYDRNSDHHFDVISAFIKSVRGSDADAAIHYLARMLESGEDPRFIARRLMILAAEDVGLADPQALVLATSAAQSVALIGMPEARIALSEITIYMCLAPKSNSAYLAINRAIRDVKDGKSGEVPKNLRNTYPAQLEAGSYAYAHDENHSVAKQDYLPDTLRDASYYAPKEFGLEEMLSKRWALLKKIIRGH
jgi:putative ATPase